MNPLPLSPNKLLGDPAYRRLKQSLIAWTGLAYYADKDRELAGHIVQRMARVGLADGAAYLTFLENGATGQAELDMLIADLTIGETFFFRHQEIFNALRTIVLPELIASNRHCRHLRIWSAGCSTGAEAYSLAMLLKRDLGGQLDGWDATIIGTDINRTFLARAREGLFDEWAFRNTPDAIKSSCFTREGNAWRINAEFRDGVSFQYHNLVTHPFPSMLNNLFAFDVILCRNVTIYFSQDIVRQLIGHFRNSLVDGGWLLVGHAEPNMELYSDFRTVNAPGAVLYQKLARQTDRHAESRTDWQSVLPSTGESRTDWQSVLPSTAGLPIAPTPWQPVSLPPDLPESLTSKFPTPTTPIARSAETELEMVRALADRGEWEVAAAACQKMLDGDKLNPRVYYYQALVLEQIGKHAEAERALRQVIYLDRGSVLGHYYLGLLLQKNGRLPQAALSFRNVLQLLTRMEAERTFADSDGISAGELRKLTEMHLEVLEAA